MQRQKLEHRHRRNVDVTHLDPAEFEHPAKQPVKLTSNKLDLVVAGMSANTLKLLHTLLKHNVIRMTEGDYQAFVAIYHLATKEIIDDGKVRIIEDYEPSIRKHDMKKLKAIVSRIEINRHLDANLVLMGDAFVSKGSNDYFTLLLLNHLKNHGVDLSLIMSPNTDLLTECLQQAVLTGRLPEADEDEDHNSYNNMHLLLKMNFIRREEINDLMATFTDSLKPVYCTLSNETYEQSTYFKVYSHTPMTRAKFFALGLVTGVRFDDADSFKFFESLRNINNAVKEAVVKSWTQIDRHRYRNKHSIFHPEGIKSAELESIGQLATTQLLKNLASIGVTKMQLPTLEKAQLIRALKVLQADYRIKKDGKIDMPFDVTYEVRTHDLSEEHHKEKSLKNPFETSSIKMYKTV